MQPGGAAAEGGPGLPEPEAQSFADDGALGGGAGDGNHGGGEGGGVVAAERAERVPDGFLVLQEVGVGEGEGEGGEARHEGQVVGEDSGEVGVPARVGEGDDVEGGEVGVQEVGGDVAVEGVAGVEVKDC